MSCQNTNNNYVPSVEVGGVVVLLVALLVDTPPVGGDVAPGPAAVLPGALLVGGSGAPGPPKKNILRSSFMGVQLVMSILKSFPSSSQLYRVYSH